MKKSIAILFVLLLIAGAAYARMTVVGIAGMAGESLVHDCSTSLYFGWSAESETVTTGTPPGCAEDTSAIAQSGASLEADPYDGTYSIWIGRDDGGYERYDFSLTSQPTTFTARFFLKITTWTDNAKLIRCEGSATDYWEILLTLGDELKFLVEGQDTYVSNTTSDLALDPTDGWVLVQVALDVSADNADLFIGVDLDLDGTWDYSSSSANATAFTAGAFDAYTLRIGNHTSHTIDYNIDKIQIYSGFNTANPL